MTSKESAPKKINPCWPGYEPVPGKKPRAKGSCKPKARQTATEKKSDARAAAASRLRKAK